MPQSLSQIYLHIVFSTKKRIQYFTDTAIRRELHAMITGIAKTKACPCLRVGGVADHVHIFVRLSRTATVADLVKEIKRVTCEWLKQKWPEFRAFQWQAGYSAFSISPSHVDGLDAYIRDQEQHHTKESFQDELRRFFKKYGVIHDEQYVWD